MSYKVALPYGCNFCNRNKLGGGVRRGGRAIYIEMDKSILSASVIHSHVYPSDIFNQHLILDTQPLTPTNQYILLGINYPSHIV